MTPELIQSVTEAANVGIRTITSAVVAAVGIVGIVVYFVLRRRRRRKP